MSKLKDLTVEQLLETKATCVSMIERTAENIKKAKELTKDLQNAIMLINNELLQRQKGDTSNDKE